MTTYLRSSLTIVWLVLITVTFLAWWMGASAHGIIAMALLKIGLVIWHFMEVRAAPAWLRWNCAAWLGCFALMLMALYAHGRP